MEKKSYWVVTRVDVGRVTFSVNTYALRWFDDINEAKSFLESEYNNLCAQGYEPSGFERNIWGWTYKSEFLVSQVMISLAPAI